ncbi:hypothetical protein BHE90_012893 [Fusarium euwallaceae]|uniref:Uncharacterized protein n=2 Tax=Fusarium solani species complex TaxID=232080 RepID=A0A428TQD2_9HYPO|nr:hypothetical protein CEP52_006935 [Fusarium oligoseptatum]RTE72680.1 hypothetical protein BHE90_012893 [Fusarium euwallaceae]
MSQPTRPSGDAGADAGNPSTRNTDSSFDGALALMDQTSDFELPAPALDPVSHEGERLSSTWRKECMDRVIDRLRVKTRTLNDLVRDRKTAPLLVGKHHSEFPPSERAELAERVQALRQASQAVKNEVWELKQVYDRDRDAPRIGEAIKKLTDQTSELEFKLNLF